MALQISGSGAIAIPESTDRGAAAPVADGARPLRVLVVGKPNLMRDGLWALLSAQGRMDVLASLDPQSAAIRSVPVSPSPDVVLMHYAIVTPDALEAVTAVRGRWPSARVVVLTARLDDQIICTAMQAGVDACVSETDSHLELLTAIRTVADGERYFSRSTATSDLGLPDNLTEREKEVTRLIAAGYRTREMATRLSLSCKTIEKHRGNIMRKLGLRSAAAVAAYATSYGYV